IDRRLYLPKDWTDDPARLKAAHVPRGTGFATKPQIARRMIARAIRTKVPFSFVAADSVYGTGEIETTLRKAGKGYVLGVASNHGFHSWGKRHRVGGTAATIAQDLPKNAWRRLSAGDGTKGPRRHDWAYVELADLDAGHYNRALRGQWTRGLLIRRDLTGDDNLAFFSTWCPKGTPMEKLVSVEGRRWSIEDSFETAKNELGLDHNETRSWHGWHRHVSLVMLAFAMMAVIRHHANAGALKKTLRRLPLTKPS
ncbi:MAG: IS701 family transposase, partial [Xanthobacteraceae bacterium]